MAFRATWGCCTGSLSPVLSQRCSSAPQALEINSEDDLQRLVDFFLKCKAQEAPLSQVGLQRQQWGEPMLREGEAEHHLNPQGRQRWGTGHRGDPKMSPQAWCGETRPAAQPQPIQEPVTGQQWRWSGFDPNKMFKTGPSFSSSVRRDVASQCHSTSELENTPFSVVQAEPVAKK